MRQINSIQTKSQKRIWPCCISIGLMLIALALSGCAGPPALRKTVLGYDELTNQVEQELMLLNIARAHHLDTPHFTVTGSIAATFDFTASGALGAKINERVGSSSVNSLGLNLGASASENPTFSIVPISGKEFTQRLVTPFQENAYSMLVYQGSNIQLVTRIMGNTIEFQERDGRLQRLIVNDPRRPKEYKEFRKVAMHLAGLQNSHQLFVYDLYFDEVVIDGLKNQPKGEDLWKGKHLKWRLNPDGTWKVIKETIDRVLISNYDPRGLTNDERFQLNEIAKDNAGNCVMIDIRTDHPGGDFPIFGVIKLRSFLDILMFVGLGIEKVEEFHVTKDPRTPGTMLFNPAKTVTINVTEEPPPSGVPRALYGGKYYSLADTEWDRLAFMILSILFQVTVTDVSRVGIPITIAK